MVQGKPDALLAVFNRVVAVAQFAGFHYHRRKRRRLAVAVVGRTVLCAVAGHQGRAVCAVALYHAIRASGHYLGTAVGVAAGGGIDGSVMVEEKVKKAGWRLRLTRPTFTCRPGKRKRHRTLRTYLRRQVVPCGPSSRMIPISVRRLRAASAAAQSFA